MDYEPSFTDSQSTLELRVLSGPQAGARAALDPGNVCMLAAGLDDDGADIMLREDRETPVRVRMVAGRDMAMIEVLDGPVMMGEQSVAAGESTAWAMHTPLKVGDSVVAFGRAGDETWPEGGGAAASVAPSDRHRDSWRRAAAVAAQAQADALARCRLCRRRHCRRGRARPCVFLVAGNARGGAHTVRRGPARERVCRPRRGCRCFRAARAARTARHADAEVQARRLARRSTVLAHHECVRRRGGVARRDRGVPRQRRRRAGARAGPRPHRRRVRRARRGAPRARGRSGSPRRARARST